MEKSKSQCHLFSMTFSKSRVARGNAEVVRNREIQCVNVGDGKSKAMASQSTYLDLGFIHVGRLEGLVSD